MKINWTVRLKNKTWLVSFLTVAVAFVYQVLGMLDIVPPVTQDMTIQLISVIINVLAAVGVVIDPTTASISDSKQAMLYTKPKED